MNNHLIPITNTDDGITAVMGRDLHDFLEIRSNYTEWFGRMVEYGFNAGQDFIRKSESTGMGRPTVNHIMTMDMAKEVSMIQRTDKGKQAREYFLEVERQYKNQSPAVPQTYAEALRSAADAHERAMELEAKVVEDAPKVEYHDRFISEDSDVMTIDDWAAQYGIAKSEGLQILRDKKVIYKKPVTREFSKKRKEQVDRMEHRSYKPYRYMFDLRPQLKAPRYNNGQMRQTLYVRVSYSTQLAEIAGFTSPQMKELF